MCSLWYDLRCLNTIYGKQSTTEHKSSVLTNVLLILKYLKKHILAKVIIQLPRDVHI